MFRCHGGGRLVLPHGPVLVLTAYAPPAFLLRWRIGLLFALVWHILLLATVSCGEFANRWDLRIHLLCAAVLLLLRALHGDAGLQCTSCVVAGTFPPVQSLSRQVATRAVAHPALAALAVLDCSLDCSWL